MKLKKNKTFIIAEVGNNHEGNFELAKELIYLASKTGADAVKFQYIVPNKLINDKETKRIKTLNKFLLSKKNFIYLSKFAKKNNIIFFATPFDKIGVDGINQCIDM